MGNILPISQNHNMIEKSQKYAPTLSLLLLLALVFTLLFSPPSVPMLSTLIILFGIGTAILLAVKNNREEKQKRDLSTAQFTRNLFIDLLGLALVMGLAMWMGRSAGEYAGQSWGIFASIIASVAVGFAVGFGVQKVWRKVAEPVKAL